MYNVCVFKLQLSVYHCPNPAWALHFTPQIARALPKSVVPVASCPFDIFPTLKKQHWDGPCAMLRLCRHSDCVYKNAGEILHQHNQTRLTLVSVSTRVQTWTAAQLKIFLVVVRKSVRDANYKPLWYEIIKFFIWFKVHFRNQNTGKKYLPNSFDFGVDSSS